MEKASRQRSRCRIRFATGFTLLELVATLSVLLVIAVAAASILGSVTEIGIDRRHHAEGRAAVTRFADDFRRDAAMSDQIDVFDDGASIQLRSETDLIEYRWNDSAKRLTRALSRNDGSEEIRSEDVLESDSYALGRRCDPKFTVGGDLVRVVLRGPAGATPSWVVEASR